MDQPLVCAVMLTNGRPEMVRRAVASFRAQTYPAKRLLVYHAAHPLNDPWSRYGISLNYLDGGNEMLYERMPPGGTIGRLRNEAAESILKSEAGIIAHWDSDDYSHPNRLTEQVALLEASGKECVGYRDMLFWDTTNPEFPVLADGSKGPYGWYQAWLYTNDDTRYCLGTSMLYWRKTWEAHPFADSNEGCDDLDWYRNGVQMKAVSSLCGGVIRPRMIATIHGGNTTARIDTASPMWHRVPEWDEYCRKRLAL